MTAILYLEASQSNGKTYRLALALIFPVQVVSMMALIGRLF
jgi:hypothetical protein